MNGIIGEDTVGKKIIKRGSNRKDRRMIFKEEGMKSMKRYCKREMLEQKVRAKMPQLNALSQQRKYCRIDERSMPLVSAGN